MKLFWWILAALLLGAMGVAEWQLLAALRAEIREPGKLQPRSAPYSISISGPALQARAREELLAANAARMARADRAVGDAVVLEGITYERNGGVVRAQGKVRDLADGRKVLAVIDAYDDEMHYLTSAAVPLQTVRASPSAFTIHMPDRADLSSLSFRVLSEADRSEIVAFNEQDLQKRRTAFEDRATLLPDDAVLPVDIQEAEERLRHLGYVTASRDVGLGEPAMRVVFNRFRRDHGLPPSRTVDLETFLALRIVTPGLQTRYRAEL
ncbi:hypothetical protein [Sphingomonas sp. 3-13AW]|uniref:hypothetical protein n=1 Tax=Sphingomonas sp. 3-13AW TaxID=3050450 RepID=UPI003BB4DACF